MQGVSTLVPLYIYPPLHYRTKHLTSRWCPLEYPLCKGILFFLAKPLLLHAMKLLQLAEVGPWTSPKEHADTYRGALEFTARGVTSNSAPRALASHTPEPQPQPTEPQLPKYVQFNTRSAMALCNGVQTHMQCEMQL